MKKNIFLVCLTLCIVFSSIFNCSAQSDFFNEQIESSGANELLDKLSDEQLELLDMVGLNELDFDKVFSVSPKKVFDLFYEVIRQEYISPFKSCLTAAAMIICSAVASVFITSSKKLLDCLNIFVSICVSLCIIIPMSECLSRAVSAVCVTSDFILALIPVLAAVITVIGKPTVALTYNSLCFAAAQFVSAFMSDFIRPLIQVTLSISMITGISNFINLEKTLSFIKKSVMFLMSFFSTVFITMLSIKGMLAASADNVAVRGVRFLIGNLIPVVGGAVSDAYNSIAGTLSLVKNTVAVVGIAAVAVIVMPVFIECMCWVLSLNLLVTLSDMFSQNKISSLLNGISSSVVLLGVTLVFIFVVFVLGIGLIMLMKGGA